ncbi:hypothetical protein [Pseudanabaena sp. UWO310]|uniref:hypothetical protein n=1 Tax=Pseudanabaena sp. UWO310 TaxID=2480795 RepID=UPI0011579B8E|nr:hypothetical protein [Pseudanabaena sp. UWO310]TYQ26919.1 hypothetical protein PseudUWO310_16540 [Pseudanabaena sp. UWO310]
MVQATSPQVKFLSYAEYYAYDDGSDNLYELEDGELVEGFYDQTVYTGDGTIKSMVIPEIEISLSDILG